MGNINTEMYQALKLANVPEEQAIAAAEAVARGQDAATKSDLTEFAARLSSQMDIGFAEFRKETNERFEGIEERFEGIDERFEGIDEQFKKIDERFEGIDEQFKKIDERFEGIDEQFNQFQQQFAEQRKESQQQFAEQRKESQQQFAEQRKEMKELRKENGEGFSKHGASLAVLKFAVITLGSAILALLIKLVFFP